MAKPLSELLIVGGNVAIDFVNTVGGMRDAPPDPDDDVLTGYEELAGRVVRAHRPDLTP